MSIKQNITNLQNLLEQVNALPEASDNTPTNVTLNFSWTAISSTYMPAVFYSYINENGDYASNVYLTQTATSGSTTLTVAKNSTICIICRNTTNESSGVISYSMTDGVSKLDNNYVPYRYKNALYLVTNDGQLTVGMGFNINSGGGSN